MPRYDCFRISKMPLWILLGFLLLPLSCDKSSASKALRNPDVNLSDLQKAIKSGELYPLATGDAYLVAENKVFFISGGEAVRVKGLPSSLILMEVHALADGSALLKDGFSDLPVLYHLRKDVATKVVEKEGSLYGKTQIPNLGAFHFVEAQQLKRKLIDVEESQGQDDYIE